MRSFERKKLNKILIITIIVLTIIAIIVGITLYIMKSNKNKEITYEDKIICNNYFNEIKIDLENKKVKRDSIDTTMQKEFDIDEGKENLILSSQEELNNFFAGSTFEVNIKDNIAYITNKYQTKRILIKANDIKDNFEAQGIAKLQNGITILQYDTQARTKAAFEYFQTVPEIEKAETDEVLHIENINDESQTLYGKEKEKDKEKYNTHGISAMGLNKYKNIINENGNPSDITIATVGYGIRIDNQYFNGRIDENYYNFILNSKDVNETISQGSRIAEVIKESTTDNVKILPVVVVNNEGYTTVATIVKAIEYAVQKSDIICYELINKNNDMITIALENAFKENKPVSCVTTSNEKENYPANSSTTIAVSSIDKNNQLATFSGKGDYIDFTAYATDVKEIFDKNISVSKWSGAQYSNAHIVSAMALIKTYNKDYTILEVYNILRNYCEDLGKEGRDELYGYGCPNFSKITIADIDKKQPEIKEVKYDNEKWETLKQIQIVASDNIRILEYAVTKTKDKPEEWKKLEQKTPNLDVVENITENSKYYIWVKDSAGNIATSEIEINKIDSTGPTIAYNIDQSTLDTEKYVTISATAEDKDSGLNEMPYSWDNTNWGIENNILKVTENGRYKIYARDVLGNVSEKEIVVDCFPREGIANINEGTIIKSIVVSTSWDGDNNNAVRITFNSNQNIIGWRITKSSNVPEYFEEIEMDNNDSNNEINIEENTLNLNSVYEPPLEEQQTGYNSDLTITKSLKAKVKYYAWIKDADNNVKYQTFTISKVEI